jgi:hypothetical protein
MAIDASIPLGVQSYNPMQNLSSLMGIMGQRQSISASQTAQQGQQFANTNAQISTQERQALQPILSDPTKYIDPATGDIDLNKLTPLVMQAAPTTGMDVVAHAAQAQQARTQARSLISQQTDGNNSRVGAAISSLDPEKATSDDVEKLFGVVGSMYPSPDMQTVLGHMKGTLQRGLQNPDPAAKSLAVTQASRMFLPPQTQQDMNTPSVTMNNNGSSYQGINLKPGVQGLPQGAPVPGTGGTIQPGPTTPTMGADGTQGIMGAPQANFSGVQGPARSAILADIAARDPGSSNAREAVNSLSGRPQGFIPSSLPAGQAQNIANNVDEMNRHFSSLQDGASGAALQQGLIGNIKSLSAGAATGLGAGRKAFVSGLLSAMHVPSTGDEAKDTDLLEKNMAQLNLSTPSSTDAMRTIVNAARPHGTMQEGAINEAADQLSGQISANMATRNALSGYKMMGDAQGYQTARAKLETIADPRAWQYMNLGPGSPEAKAFISKLAPADRAALGSKIEQLENMGMLK